MRVGLITMHITHHCQLHTIHTARKLRKELNILDVCLRATNASANKLLYSTFFRIPVVAFGAIPSHASALPVKWPFQL